MLGLVVCTACARLLTPLGHVGCLRCGAPGAWPVERCVECKGRRISFAGARAAIAYDDRARALVVAWKEGGRRDVTGWAAARVAETCPVPIADVVVPVPGDRDRTLSRGHVPARGLARALGRIWEVPCEDALERTGRGVRQRGLRAAERRMNVRGAFVARGSVARRVCLVDDVYTTGSTVNACALALRRGGADRVWVVTLARAVR
jgi:ComF family protein